jgi:hypothetical protein
MVRSGQTKVHKWANARGGRGRISIGRRGSPPHTLTQVARLTAGSSCRSYKRDLVARTRLAGVGYGKVGAGSLLGEANKTRDDHRNVGDECGPGRSRGIVKSVCIMNSEAL